MYGSSCVASAPTKPKTLLPESAVTALQADSATGPCSSGACWLRALELARRGSGCAAARRRRRRPAAYLGPDSCRPRCALRPATDTPRACIEPAVMRVDIAACHMAPQGAAAGGRLRNDKSGGDVHCLCSARKCVQQPVPGCACIQITDYATNIVSKHHVVCLQKRHTSAAAPCRELISRLPTRSQTSLNPVCWWTT